MSQEEIAEQAAAAKEHSFRQWLGGIDPEVTSDSRAETINGLLKFLANNDVRCVSDLDDMVYPRDFEGTVKGGKVALLYKVMKEVNKHKLQQAQQQFAADPGGRSLDMQMLDMQTIVAAGSSQAIAQLRAVQTVSHVKVNVTERLLATNLEDLGDDLLPAGTLTDWLATEAQKERTRGVLTPFIALSVKKWVPQWVPLIAAELRQEDAQNDMSDPQLRATQQLAQQMGAPVKKRRWLTHMQWLCGFRLAAQSYNACGMWKYTSILAHEQNCMQIAVEAELDNNRQFWLAVIYDEMVRQKWHDLAYSNRSNFDVNIASTTIDEKVLASAQKEFDAARRPQVAGKGGGKHDTLETKSVCFTCGEAGHRRRDCPLGNAGKDAGGKGKDGGGKGKKRKFH